jgi:hypothetical protein
MTRRLRIAALVAVAALAFSACANNDAKESDVVNAMKDAGLDTEQAECIGQGINDAFSDDQKLYNEVAAATNTDDFPEGSASKFPDGTKGAIEDILDQCLGSSAAGGGSGSTSDTTDGSSETTTTTAGG